MMNSRRPRVQRVKSFLSAPALSRTPLLLCGSVLVSLALVSLITGPLLDLDIRQPRPTIVKTRNDVATTTLANSSSGRTAKSSVSRKKSDGIWTSKLAPYFHACSSPKSKYAKKVSEMHSSGYLLIQTSGGLNQQRTGIIDAVVVARILNATLVVPHLDHKSFWKDNSNFSDIFDIDWFIKYLGDDVPIVKELPPKFHGKFYSMRVSRRCKAEFYKNKILPILRKKKAIRLGKFDYRLSNRLEEDLQKLRCRVNYHALQFTNPIESMGQTLVNRLRQKTSRYIALHLRFEPDMLAFSGCYYGGGEKEMQELGLLRKRWKTIHNRNPERERRNGKCPLTPEEVGIMLRALGFGSDSHIYVASGEVYGGESTLAPLRKLFPNYHTKESLANDGELQPFESYSSRMAAIDYIVCDQSDVFITNNNGNMARILAGRRRYFGHKVTIRPNAKRLGSLFLAKPNMTWDAFALKLRSVQKGFMGEPNEMRPGRGQFFENPSACICENKQEKESPKDVLQEKESLDMLHEKELEEVDMLGKQGQPISVSNEEEEDEDADPDLEDMNLMQQEELDEEDDELEKADEEFSTLTD